MIKRTILPAGCWMLAACTANAATFAVTTMADAGTGSLRWAIGQANGVPGPDTIVFHHVVSEDHCGADDVFWLESPLPAIIDDVIIDGFSANLSQPGGDDVLATRVCVRLQPDPNAAVAIPYGLRVSSLVGPDVTVDIRGLQFNGFGFAGLDLAGGSHHMVLGNTFGGSDGAPNTHGIVVGAGASDVWIGDSYLSGGGGEDDLGNWINNSTISGVVLEGDDSIFRYNHVGPAPGSVAANTIGIETTADYSEIIGNSILASDGDGLLVGGGYAFVVSNTISGNGASGIRMPGGFAWVLGNDITDNGVAGIRIEDGGGSGDLASFAGGNSIHGNAGLGIDLGLPGPGANNVDAQEPAGAANQGQNHPVLTHAKAWLNPVGGNYRGTVEGTLSSRPNRGYGVNIYANDACDPSGYGEGASHVGVDSIQLVAAPPGSDASTTFSIEIESPQPLVGRYATATARGAGSSEFSACIPIGIANAQPMLTGRTFVLDAAQDLKPVTLGPLVHSDDGLPNPPGALSFSIPGNTTPFSVSNTGHIAGTPDFAANPGGYQFAVEVSDGEVARQATVKILRNAAPVIADRYLYVPYSQNGKPISLLANASDDGHPNPPAKIAYAIMTPGTPFSISDTGSITGIASVATQPAGGYVFDVEASDGELSDHAKVHVRLNTPPVMADKTFTIPFHDFGTSVVLGFLTASDDGLPAPAYLTYDAPGENTPFALRSDGRLTGIADFTGAPNGYTLLVKVSDKEAESQATIHIVPGPANLAPVMSDTTFVLDDSQHMQPVVLGPLSASDDGLGVPAGTLTFHEHNYTIFTVSSDGLITGTPNFKTAPQGYTIEVLVSDGDLDTIAKVRIAPETIFRSSFDQ